MKEIKDFEKKWRNGINEDFEFEKIKDEYNRGFKDGSLWILDLIKEELINGKVR